MSSKRLYLGPELNLPALDAQTGTMIVYGGKGMGKTNFGSVFVEELDRHNLRFSWLDPVGVAWGLKHSADGKDVPVPVAGLSFDPVLAGPGHRQALDDAARVGAHNPGAQAPEPGTGAGVTVTVRAPLVHLSPCPVAGCKLCGYCNRRRPTEWR